MSIRFFNFFNKGFIVEKEGTPGGGGRGGGGGGGGGGGWRGERSLKRKKKKNQEERVSSLSLCSLCEKNSLIFKQQEFFLISYLGVAKSFSVLSVVQHIKLFRY